jgi:hypothetical protein
MILDVALPFIPPPHPLVESARRVFRAWTLILDTTMITRNCQITSFPPGDRAGIGAATVCAIHCVATPWLVSAMPLYGLAVGGKRTELVLLCTSLAISSTALVIDRVDCCEPCWRAVLAFLAGAGVLIVVRAGFEAEGVAEMATVTVGASLIVYAHMANVRHRHSLQRSLSRGEAT